MNITQIIVGRKVSLSAIMTETITPSVTLTSLKILNTGEQLLKIFFLQIFNKISAVNEDLDEPHIMSSHPLETKHSVGYSTANIIF